MSDPVNHPAHYTSLGARCSCGRPVEAIDVTEALPFLEGNIVKYVWRWRSKNGVEDLRKARFYLDRLIANAERPCAPIGLALADENH